MARYEEVQAAQIREGEHRGAANRLRTEHKEVGSGPGAGSAEVGADGGPTPAGSGESFPASFDRMVAFFRRSKGVFQQADKDTPQKIGPDARSTTSSEDPHARRPPRRKSMVSFCARCTLWRPSWKGR